MGSQSLRDKIAFFEDLEALNTAADEEEDQLSKEDQEFRKISRAFFEPLRKTGAPPPSLKPFLARECSISSPRRSFSAPTPILGTPQCPIIIEATPGARGSGNAVASQRRNVAPATAFAGETPVPDSAGPSHASLQRSVTLPLPSRAAFSAAEQSPSAASSMRKRKRQTSARPTVPESEQIFRHLRFYYIPNDDIAPTRKLRIGKAQEYGAQWVRDLSSASHIVVDNRLEYTDIEKILVSGPDPLPTLINEDYPIDCITYRALLNPNQQRYKVRGSPVEKDDPVPECIPSPINSDHSLPLTRPPRARRTPSVSTESPVQVDVVRVLPPGPGSQNAGNQPDSVDSGGQQQIRQQVQLSSIADMEAMTVQSSRNSVATAGIQDELADCIQLMRKYKDLPLDVEEDDDGQSLRDEQAGHSDSDATSGTDNGRARKKRPSRETSERPGHNKVISFEDRFACNRGGTLSDLSDPNPNARTIEILQSMCDYYTRVNDHWRTTAYRKGITTLRRQTTKIATEEEAYRLPGIGHRLAAKIEEIANTNALRRLDYARDEPLDQALAVFLGVYGVGLACARRWLAQGFRTLDDIRSSADLTPNQRLGVERYNDLNTRIPRAEVTALGDYVKREAAAIDPAIELLIGGSYRRGSESSGDIDFIVTKKGTTSVAGELVNFLEELIRVLTQKGFLVATLAALHSSHRPGKDGPGSKWHGCCVLLPSEYHKLGSEERKVPVWRRIDFLLVPESEYGAALIYFTGNDIFNRSMRLLASKKGMRLNQRGLYKEVMRGQGRVKVTEGELVEGRDERRIFEVLGVKWREPWERWC